VKIGNIGMVGGAIILLLPFLLLSNIYSGFSASNSYTDNLYFIGEIERGGNKTNVSPFISYSGLLDFNYSGDVSIIDFDKDDIFIGNQVGIEKRFNLPGLGNRNYLYLSGYNFIPVNYQNYGLNEIYGGDSLSLYLGNFLLSTGMKIGYVNFISDSIEDYFKPEIKTNLSIPMPYFYFVPGAGAGLIFYKNERLPYYNFSLSLDFPLTGDFTMFVSGNCFWLSEPEIDYLISDSLLLDPFFENEGVVRNINLNLSINKIFVEQKSYVNLYLAIFEKNFFEIGNILRNDSGIFGGLQYTKMISNNISLFFSLSSKVNNSTIENLSYTKNNIGGGIQLIF
jgi:hypothetical protein